MGSIIGLTAGLYGAINLLGAGGGRPNSAQTIQTVNATLCAVFAVSSAFGGSVLNTLGPAITALLGIVGYILYLGSLWYFDQTGNEWFPIFAGVIIGVSARVYLPREHSPLTNSHSRFPEPDLRDDGIYLDVILTGTRTRTFIAISVNLQATGMAIGGLIPLIINRKSQEVAGVPTAVYIILMCLMGAACILALCLRPASKVIRQDGTQVATIRSRGYWDELRSNLEVFRDWKALLLVPAFLPSECYLVYNGSVNAYHDDLRARSLLSFCSVALQIPAGYGLQKLLDHKTWTRRKRGFAGLAVVGAPLMAAWIWEIIRVHNYDRKNHPMDWSDPKVGAIFVLFCLNWVSCALFQYIILYFLSCMTNSPRKAANYAGLYRTFLAVHEGCPFTLSNFEILVDVLPPSHPDFEG
ncbi:uncharacterized protein Z518_00114 [Rhinocladiella mackenziei CBS 650.93]|uniref:Uncharacterized protein n=1 Tax=Rhinocladiella mackenziei CBS 650.93 TaxID=1442369 RepID=A0A0D2J098_9EURO|nr:uncharacterized protein Z518_00114 [Rhinocladiella mackenziei CBS 650.93]KIX09036.1 hypothetical protein Z518_00114 [Rhinocladiella mackenziei CBS 650.93]